MPKKVVYLVQELKAKSSQQVFEWLREVGYDTSQEGFGMMSEIDDETIVKLKAFATGKGKAVGPPKRIKRAVPTAEVTATVVAPPAPVTMRDFFKEEAAAAEVAPVVPVEIPVALPPPVPITPPAPRLKSIIEDRPAGKKVKLTKTKKEEPKADAAEVEVEPELEAVEAEVEAVEEEIAVAERKREVKKDKPPVAPVDTRAKPKDRRSGRHTTPELQSEDDVVVGRGVKRVFKVKGVTRTDKQKVEVVRHLRITRPISLRDVSEATGVRVPSIIRFLMDELNILATINYVASIDEVSLICEKFKINYEVAPTDQPEQDLETFAKVDKAALKLRPPVVTVMGHVDHGKTKLLDAIRTTNVVDQEAGGITQHIGAYQAKVMIEGQERIITFIDTPGHEAFTAMRARGAQITDIVVLVVAADDGVMPQTVEAIEHCKMAKVPVIVAVNKIDKGEAQPDRVRQQLSQYDLIPEDWGGETVYCNVSALARTGIDSLLEHIILVADLMELKSDASAAPMGIIIENEIDPGVGIVATILVMQGTFHKSDYILCGTSVGRIKRMIDDKGKEMTSAGPAQPARIIGFEAPPENGEKVYGFHDKKRAQQIADSRDSVADKFTPGATPLRVSLEDVFTQIRSGEAKELNVVLKADVQGSLEAVREALAKIDVEGVKVNIIRSGVGQINETDIMLASPAGAMVIGFNVTLAGQLRKLAEREKVQVRIYRIIYKLLEDIELAVSGLLEPDIVDVPLGELEIRAIFHVDRNAVICGGMVTHGKIQRNAYYNLRRGTEIILEGQLGSLKRFKDDVREVTEGFECGLRIDGTADVKEGDVLELYIKETRQHVFIPSSERAEAR
jgi:translation initiation factor IF-2